VFGKKHIYFHTKRRSNMSNPFPIPFPLNGGRQVGSDYTSPDGNSLEPSGLVVLNSKLYMASDNGYLMSVDLASSTSLDEQDWALVHNFSNAPDYKGHSESYDLECLTVVTGKLMIGVEGNRSKKSKSSKNSYNPHIIQYGIVNDHTTGSIWDITDVNLTGGGMEAMTFVPLSACLHFGGTAYYGGYFFAAYQSKQGYVYVYDLPEGNNDTHKVKNHLKKFEVKDGNGEIIMMEASDMCFADGYLFVLFDGGGSQNELHLFAISSDGNSLDHVSATYLPKITGVWEEQAGFEGITIDGSNLYLAVDAKKSDPPLSPSNKLVWCYTNYSINEFT
jgi:hypothetical protein